MEVGVTFVVATPAVFRGVLVTPWPLRFGGKGAQL